MRPSVRGELTEIARERGSTFKGTRSSSWIGASLRPNSDYKVGLQSHLKSQAYMITCV